MKHVENVKEVKDVTRVFEVRVASPRGFCAGVDRAIEIVNRALTQFGTPVYVRHEVVHNKYVVQDLRERGAIFVEEVREIRKAPCVFLVLTVCRSRFGEMRRPEA